MADYHKLAGMMANHGEVAIFRRFDQLNLKNLLYMQAELIHLEAELHQMELDEKSAANSSKPAYPFSVYDLREAACSGKVTQWTKYQEVQSKLQAYSMCYETRLQSADSGFTTQTAQLSNILRSAKLSSLMPTALNAFASG